MRYLLRFALLMVAFTLTTLGLLAWHAESFSLANLTSLDEGLHPAVILTVGLAMIPPALWEIFLLEAHDDT